MPLIALACTRRNTRGRESAKDVNDVHLPGERPGEQTELRERRPALEGDRRLPFLVEEALADQVWHAVEEPVDPLEAEVGHPDLVGVRESERDPVGAEPVGRLVEALQ